MTSISGKLRRINLHVIEFCLLFIEEKKNSWKIFIILYLRMNWKTEPCLLGEEIYQDFDILHVNIMIAVANTYSK